jgi:hypothetical protein
MKRFTPVGLVVAAAMMTGCLARPNPRVSTIVKQPANDDDDTEQLSFRYDAEGRIEEVEKHEGAALRTWELTWNEGVLARVVISDDDGATRAQVTHALSYESGRLVSTHAETDDESSDGVFSYDEQGRFAKSQVTSDDEESVAIISYGDDGQIRSMTNESTAAGVTTASTIHVGRSDGVLSSLTIDGEGAEPHEFALSFDEETKQLDQIAFDSEATFAGAPVRGVVAFHYDDEGRVESTEHTADLGDIQADVATTEVEYEDGDASSLDMSANQVMLFGFFFDMKGTHYGTFDNTTTVPRLAFTSW